jgi:hypothetical protein
VKKLDVFFAPLSFDVDWIPIPITTQPLKRDALSKSVSNALERDVSILQATIDWRSRRLSCGFNEASPSVFIAFDVRDESKLYIPVFVEVELKSELNTRLVKKGVVSTFLITVDDEEATEEQRGASLLKNSNRSSTHRMK